MNALFVSSYYQIFVLSHIHFNLLISCSSDLLIIFSVPSLFFRGHGLDSFGAATGDSAVSLGTLGHLGQLTLALGYVSLQSSDSLVL
jgi:hypothetical protein